MKQQSFFLSLVLSLFLVSNALTAQVNEYLKVVGSATVVVKQTGTVSEMPDLWYSIDGGDWSKVTIDQLPCSLQVQGISYSHPQNGYVRFKGNNPGGFNHSSTNFISFAVTGGNPAVEGNVMSLLGEDFATNTTIPCDYCFYALFSPYPPTSFATSFSSSSTSASTSLARAHELVLPATELKPYCYAYMFAQNSGLYSAPALPATVMQPWCYAHMFEYCINNLGSQTSANSGYYLPDLPAQQLAEGCYAYMFNRCSSLYNNDENYYVLPAEELAPKCYMGMFGLYNAKGTTLRYVEIMATSLQDRCGNDLTNCCAYMFNNAIAAGTYLGRGGLTVRFYWLDWGTFNGTAQTGDGPAQSWFLGYSQSYNKFIYQKGLTPVTKAKYEKDYPTKMYSAPFPYSSTLTEQEFTYLTFDCATNGGTWEQGCSYKANLRRVVRSDYTAKTVPAAPHKFGSTFKGWYTAPTGGTKVEEATILSQTTAQTYYAQFEGGDINFTETRGVLDMPTYYSFAILGENDEMTVRLHFNTALTTSNTNYLSSLSYDVANSYIQPAGMEKRQIASATLAKVEYLGDAYRAAHLVAKVTDTEGITFNIDIFTNEELNLATYDDIYGTTYNKIKVETSWRTCNPFKIYGTENNEIDYLIYRQNSGRHLLYTYHSKGGGSNPSYEVLHVQIELFPDASKPGNIPTGIYPINATGETGTAFIGVLPSDILIYEQNQRQPYKGTFVQYELQVDDYSAVNRDVWTLRDGYVEVVNVDEQYYVHVHAYADAHRTTGEDCAVIDYTACVKDGVTYTPSAVTLSAQTADGTALENALTAKLANATSWTSTVFSQGSHTFFSGNTLNLTAAKNGYVFSHWLINGNRVDQPANYAYALTTNTEEIVAVFTIDDSERYDITFQDEDGTILSIESTIANQMPVYTGATPTKAGYQFNGWTPALAVATANTTYTATYVESTASSPDAAVSVYQNVSRTTMKILYDLNNRIGNDGLTYGLVDMGYGVAWADRNIGASSPTAIGDYFNWGDVVSEPFAEVVYEPGSMTAGSILPAEDDAATVNIGSDFHIPTDAEWTALFNNTTYSGGRYINNGDNSLYMNLPNSGYYEYFDNYGSYYGPYLISNTAAFCWTSQLHSRETGTYEFLSNAGIIMGGETAIYDGYIYLAAPIRGIYTPPFETCTLTINVGSYQYRYICEVGQNITVTAVATETNYTFDRWTEDGNTNATRTFAMTGNQSYTATFKQDVVNHTITIQAQPAGYGSVSQTTIDNIPHGSSLTTNDNTLIVNGTTVTATPATNTAQYTYTFTGWLGAQGTVNGDVNITALFERTVNSYSVTFRNEDGTPLQQSDWEYGALPTYNGETPVKEATDDYSYTFAGWDKTITNVTGNVTYTATYTPTARTYTVTLHAAGATVVMTADGYDDNIGTYAYGTQVALTLTDGNPFRAFTGWQDNTSATISTDADFTFTITQDTTLTAVFDVQRDLVLPEDKQNDYYDALSDAYYGDGSAPVSLNSVTLERSFKAGQWAVLNLPFHCYLEETDLDGIVYQYTGATGDFNSGIDVHFIGDVTEIEAGVPYLICPTETLNNITVRVGDGDNDELHLTEAISDADADGLAEYSDGTSGTVRFHAINRRYNLPGSSDPDWKTYVILNNNRLYYPNRNGNTLRPFRGFFRVDGVGASITPRMRIIVNGQTIETISEYPDANDTEEYTEYTEPSDKNVRKYIHHGILIIERNGVRYNAIGSIIQ